MRAFLQYGAGAASGVIAAFVVTQIVGLLLNLPADETSLGAMLFLAYCFFPILALFLGIAGLYVVARLRR